MTRSIGTSARPCSGGSSPTCTCRPRGRRLRTEFVQVTGAPRASSETCAPPPVSSAHRRRHVVAAVAPRARRRAPAPGRARRARRRPRRPGRRRPTAIWTADSPTPPQPCTATHSPGRTRPTCTTARNAVAYRQPSAAAVARSSSSGTATRFTSAASRATNSASEPQWVNPGWVWRAHTWCSPAAHCAHRPQALTNGTVTRSPTRQRRTPAPTAATVPASSCPGTCGRTTSGSCPCQACQSLRQIPLAPTRTTTPSGAGSGDGTSRTDSGPAKDSKSSARTTVSLPCLESIIACGSAARRVRTRTWRR